jgi:cyclopropane-fatty-acyl-phospholipid synthase
MTGYRGASPEAIQHHYDLGNAFYALWLDPTRTYSCALWDGPRDTLQAAQERKLDHLAEGARAVRAGRVLDVGCGWGSMLRRLVDHHGVGHATGLTLSEAQAAYATETLDNRTDVRLENWADHVPEGPYDAVVSIGAFEHFADFGMTRPARIEAYRAFFARCREWLPEGGRLALQTIVNGNNTHLDRRMTRDLLFVVDKIFPESQLPWPSEMIEASERLLDVVRIRNDADHYARTCATWLASLRARRDDAVAIVGEEAVREYERYLQTSVDAFNRRHIGLMRVVFERV